jgi:uncharacterized repeat protein (TIGR04138 family)
MSLSPGLQEKIESLAEGTGAYRAAGFLFVLRCIEHCRRRLEREGHISGKELLESARVLAMEEYGPMAKSVLNHWGIEGTLDIGNLVFLMIEHQILSKTEEDSIEDFQDGFDFETEFVTKYRW